MQDRTVSAESRFPNSFWILDQDVFGRRQVSRSRANKVTALAMLLLLTVIAVVAGCIWYKNHLVDHSKLVPVSHVLALQETGPAPSAAQVSQQWSTLDWQPVKLPHAWQDSWPGHDGKVWYGITVQVPANWAGDDLALMISSASMAHEVYWDSQLIGRDLSLQEPLSRSWNRPSYWRLKTTPNQQHLLLIGVTGYARHAAGLDMVYVGDALDVLRLYQFVDWRNQRLQQLSIGMLVALCVIFTVIWLNWPAHTYYGWYSLMLLGWIGYGYNHIAATPGWFGSTRTFHAFLVTMLMLFIAALWMFSWTLLRRYHKPHAAALWAGFLALVLLMAALPGESRWQDDAQLAALLACAAMAALSMLQWLWFAKRARTAESVILAVCVSVAGCTVIHEIAAMQGWLRSPRHFTLLLSTTVLIGIGFVLAQRLSRSLEREHHYKAELRIQVKQAEESLREAMLHNRELELQKVRLQERSRIVRDLHDGLGSTLTESIAHWSSLARPTVATDEVVDMCQQIQNELRLILETGTIADPHDFMTLFANTRLRLQRGLEQARMRTQWRIAGLEALSLEPERALPILRLLQEAVTNIIKHSAASQARITLSQSGGWLDLHVWDNGLGMAGTTQAGGIGLGSMRARAHALGGTLDIATAPGKGCQLSVRIPVAPPTGRPAAQRATATI